MLILPLRTGLAERPFAPSHGTNRVLVLLVNFSDTTTTYTPADFEDLFFGNHTSTFRDYYLQASFNQLDHVGDVVGWLRVSKTHDYYANNGYGQGGAGVYPANAHALVAEAVDLAEASGVNFKLYDNPQDGATDGVVDTLIVVHQGRGGERVGIRKNIWSFMGALSDGGALSRNCDGVVIDNFIIIPEVSYKGDRIVEVGVPAHEYGHLLGLIDLYDKGSTSISSGTGLWDLMGFGVWGGDQISPQTPILPSAYTRMKLGWLDPITIGAGTQGSFNLPALEREAVALKVPANRRRPGEYFLIENRARIGYDAALPASGIAVWHVDERGLFENRDEAIGCASLFPRLALEQADGRYDLELLGPSLNVGDTSDLFPRPSNTALNFLSATVPDSLNHDCGLSGFSLTGIGLVGDTAFFSARSDDFRAHGPEPNLLAAGLDWLEVVGDHDRYLEEGELFRPRLTLENTGTTAANLVAAMESSSPFLLIGGTEIAFPDLAPGATASAYGGPLLAVIGGFDPEVQEPLYLNLAFDGGADTITLNVRLGTPDLLYVDDDGGEFTERHLGPYLSDYGYYFDRWDTSARGTPAAFDLAGYPEVLWVTGPTQPPLSSTELAALRDYLDGGGALILSSAYLLVAPSAEAVAFARDYLHVSNSTDDRYALDWLQGISYNPLSHALRVAPMNYYFPLYNRTVGLTPDALALGAIYNDRTHYTAVIYPANFDPAPVFRSLFLSFGIENIWRTDLGQALRRCFNAFSYRPGHPWAVTLYPEKGQPRKVNLAVSATGFTYNSGTSFAFPGGGIAVASVSYVSIQQMNMTLNIGYDAKPGWHDLMVIAANGDTAVAPRMFKVEGPALPNHAPVAKAGDNQTLFRDAIAVLNGAGSSDQDYDRLTYHWQQLAGPPVSLLPSDTASIVSFDPGGIIGAYKFMLTVSDPFLSAGDTTQVTVVNRPPVARAGHDQAGDRHDVFILDGASSFDPDGDALSFQWVRTEGPPVTLLPSDTAVTASFTPDPAYVGNYRFQLTVSDPWVLAADTVKVSIVNHVPVANAGADQRVLPGAMVTLDAGGSFDLDGDSLSYFWTQVAGPDVILDLADPVHPAFLILEPGIYLFSLVCADAFDLSPADSVTVSINMPPEANAGPDRGGYRGDNIVLDGAGSFDPNGDPIFYQWRQLAGAAVALLPGDTARTVRFTAPAGCLGEYRFQLTVSDSQFQDSDSVGVTIANRAPVARAGPNLEGYRNQVFVLDADSSSDPDLDPLRFQWQQLTGPAVTLLPSDTAEAVYFPPAPDWVGVYRFRLTASDPWDQAGDTVAVNVINHPPAADAGPEVTTILGTTVTLDGDSSSDLDLDPLQYLWQQLQGPTVTLNLDDPAHPAFPATLTGNYLFALQCDDSFDVSPADTVAVIVLSEFNHRPAADAGPDQQLEWMDFSPARLDGTGSHDSDGNTIAYSWSLVSKPAGSLAQLSNPASPTPTFLDDYLGSYVIRLSVFDGEVWSSPDEMTVLTTGNTVDTDHDGLPDCLDSDDDNDTLPDSWEQTYGLNPLSAADADPNAINALTDPDGDGNGNIHEYVNGSNPILADSRLCNYNLGGCFFGEGDGDFIPGPGDVSNCRSIMKGNQTYFPAVYPTNGDNFDLDGDMIIGPGDVSALIGIMKGMEFIPAGVPVEALMVASGWTVSAAAGETVGLSLRVVSAGGHHRSGLAVIFELLSGTGSFRGGEAPLPGKLTLSEPANLNTAGNESVFCVSRDEKEIIVASDRPGGQGNFDLYAGRRVNRQAAFSALMPLTEVNSVYHDSSPALSANRLELFFTRNVTSWDLYRAYRADLNSPFNPPEPIAELNTSGIESAPTITDDGLTLYFVKWNTTTAHDIYRATRPAVGAPFGEPSPVTELNTVSAENAPGINGNDTRIFFFSNRQAGATDYNIWFAERASTAVPFSAPVPLSLVNTNLSDLKAWESPDHLRLYLSTYGYHAGNDVNIYLITRPSDRLPFWVSSRPARYDVTGTMAENASQNSGGRARMEFVPSGCGNFDLAAYGREDLNRKMPSFSATRLIRVAVPCP
jgi:M6 family metalloprotease-like protein